MLVRAHGYIFAVVGVAWVVLGITSSTTVLALHEVWIVGCSLVAGAAFAVARYRHLYALRAYMLFVLLAGATRSTMFALEGYPSATAVWVIVGGSSIVAYLELARDLER